MKILNYIALALMAAGALNWGIVGLFNYNLVGMVFGSDASGAMSSMEKLVYLIVGISGIWGVRMLVWMKCWRSKCCSTDCKSTDCCKKKHHHHHDIK